MNKTAQTFRTDIQVMRGMAVLAVVLFHTSDSWFTSGYLGVDVFFVVSGFVVTPLINRIFFTTDHASRKGLILGLRSFYMRRFFRLMPALGASLLFSLLLIFALGPVSDHSRFSSQALAALFMLGNFGAYRYSGGNYFAPFPNPLIHLWSLSAEEQIYLVLPLMILILFSISRLRRNLRMHQIIIAFGIFSFVADQLLRQFPFLLKNHGISDLPGFLFYMPVSRIWEFCIGGSAFFFSTKAAKLSFKYRKKFMWPINFVLTGLLFLPVAQYKFDSLVISLIAAIGLYFGSLAQIPCLLERWLVWFGDCSYSIYLVHMPLLYVAKYSPLFDNYRTISIIVCFGLSMLVGATIFKYVEIRFRIRREGNASSASFVKVALGFLFIPVVLSLTMRIGVEKNYWGMNPNPLPPSYMTAIDLNCHASNQACLYGVGNPIGEAILIGDSHAQSIFPAFVEVMNSLKFTSHVWYKDGCQFIVREHVSTKNATLLNYGARRYTEAESCFEHNAAIVEWLMAHPNATVYISQRSSRIRPKEITEEAFRILVLNDLRFLKRISSKLVVIGPNPEFPDGNKFFHGRLLFWQKAYIPPRTFPITSMLGEPFRDNQFFLAKLPFIGIRYVDTSKLFCNDKTCSRWSKSKWLYSDEQHLSLFGAEKLKESIGQDLKLPTLHK